MYYSYIFYLCKGQASASNLHNTNLSIQLLEVHDVCVVESRCSQGYQVGREIGSNLATLLLATDYVYFSN